MNKYRFNPDRELTNAELTQLFRYFFGDVDQNLYDYMAINTPDIIPFLVVKEES